MSDHAILKRWILVGSIGLAVWFAARPITVLGQTASPSATPTESIATAAPTLEAASTATPDATETPAPTSTPNPTETPAPTSTPAATATPAPTQTAAPTDTLVPTPTVAPSATSIPPTNVPTRPAAASTGDSTSLLLIIGGAAILLILILMVVGKSRPRSPAPAKPVAPAPSTPPTASEASLEFTQADGHVITFNLDKPIMVLGRDSSCDIVLPASLANIDSVSRQHARFQRDQDGLLVHDLESKNGLMVNGRHTNHNLLENGDRLAFGSVEATFHNKR